MSISLTLLHYRQWLPRDKIEPLGVDSRLDEVKLFESKKPSMRKNVHEAYKRAISFRRRLEIGENSDDDELRDHEMGGRRSTLQLESEDGGEILNGGDCGYDEDIPSPTCSPPLVVKFSPMKQLESVVDKENDEFYETVNGDTNEIVENDS